MPTRVSGGEDHQVERRARAPDFFRLSADGCQPLRVPSVASRWRMRDEDPVTPEDLSYLIDRILYNFQEMKS